MPSKKNKTRPATPASRTAAGGGRPGRKPPPPLPVAKPKPWGLIALTLAVVLFAAGVIGYALFRVNESSKDTPQARADAARQIQGVTVIDYKGGEHDDKPIAYDQNPPFGGKHANAWADCTGTVYPNPIRSENAVHSLEHGAVWITYRPDLPADQVDTLRKKVDGVGQMMLSPYPGLKSPISLQSWGHQLFVDSASDDRVGEFIDDLRLNSVTTPEYGAPCVNPEFKASPLPPDPAGSAPASPPATPPAGSAPTPTPTSG